MSSGRSSSLARLQRQLDYEFRNLELLQLALTHKSFSKQNNERLEFLGDAVLGFVIASQLFDQPRAFRENEMTLIRANLVRGTTLAEMARQLDLGPLLRVATGELKSGGRHRDSLLADAFEAVVGAIHEDGGIEPCIKVLQGLFGERVAEAEAHALKDPKTLLQEHLQAIGQPLPNYDVVEVSGADHNRLYTVRCDVPGLEINGQGQGSSRRSAEKAAAALVLQALDKPSHANEHAAVESGNAHD